ncbi:MAG: hypothetical protein CMK65_02045 [Pseudoalteromonas sp.]|uniref:hypothetical protein n=1 Tax=Pseudoalteromonas sp. TaxID=53249 RepID=UPI000C9606BC|nr:hypothetical protein [Pseudoalteromonas sp.]MAD02397.1 hypothetical protein [Pseudoalteromonas sp.]|tara:strand:+ start:37402 stop:38520 length:1119 start_codon:yes stop_codon:yes gene_type:complete
MPESISTSYKPNLKRLTEKRDLTALYNLEQWCEKMCIAFDRDVVDQEVKFNKTLQWLINAYPLILAYQGKTLESEAFLKKAISFWVELYKRDKDNQNLVNLIDPTINLLRLYKLTKRKADFDSHLSNISPFYGSSKIYLGGIIVTKEELGDQWETLYLATLDECLKSYTSESNFDAVMSLQDLIPQKYINNDIYIEPKIISLINLNIFDYALETCFKQIKKHKCIKNGIYSYRLYELFKKSGHESKSKTVMNHLISSLKLTKLDSLSALNFSSCVIAESKISNNSSLVTNTLKKYKEINDEFNYGMTILNLYKNNPCNEKHEELLKINEKTEYFILKEKISKELNLAQKKETKKTEWLKKITEKINKKIETQ